MTDKIKCKFCGHVSTRHDTEGGFCKANSCLCQAQKYIIEAVEGLQN